MKTWVKILIALLTVISLVLAGFCAFLLMDRESDRDEPRQEKEEKTAMEQEGGVVITYYADVDNPSKEEMETAVTMLRRKLDGSGYTEAVITVVDNDKIRIELPGADNPEEIEAAIGTTAEFTFRDKEGNVLLTGTDIKNAEAKYDAVDLSGIAQHYIQVTFTKEGQSKFAQATELISQYPDGENYIAIMLDDSTISVPQVREKIDSDTCIITGEFDAESAQLLADVINNELPFALMLIDKSIVSPSN